MSFNYDHLKKSQDGHSSWWTSYADLFMMLSIVFLLMYVTSALRSGTNGFQQQQEYKRLAQKADGLEQQIKVYNTLKDEALRKQASESEQQEYTKLMSKLSLLQEEAKDEKNALRAKALENEEKEHALNQYQQMIRNIINANILAKSQIHSRDRTIVDKNATIEEKKQKIAEMEVIVAQDEAQIRTINAKLDERIQELRQEQKRSKITRIVMDKRIAALRLESETQISKLEEKKQEIAQQLGEVRGTLAQTETKLEATTNTLSLTSADLEKRKQENAALASKLEADRSRYVAEMKAIKDAHDAKVATERQAFMNSLRRQRLSAAARTKKLAQFAAEAEVKASALEGKLVGLRSKVEQTENQLRGTAEEAARAKAALAGTQQALSGTQAKLAGTEAEKARALASVEDLKGDLARTRAIANARKRLAEQIANQFAKSGLKGAVDGKTGEVTLDFGGEYFETGSTSLKPKMRMTLDKFIPVYAKSLFSDPKLADKIANVEIVGFASSTYKGKYVNPQSVRPEDKAAIGYNLKLSFGRANAIFTHVLNQGKLTKAERERLLPLMKVVGRGYLPEGRSPAEIPDGMSEKAFCAKYNCQKAQKVTVKFNMKD